MSQRVWACIVSQPASQLVSQSVSQSASQSASQPVSQPAIQPVTQPASQSVSQSASHSVSQPAIQSANQSVSQSPSQPASQSVCLWLDSNVYCLCYDYVFMHTLCLKHNKVPQLCSKQTGNVTNKQTMWQNKLNSRQFRFKEFSHTKL